MKKWEIAKYLIDAKKDIDSLMFLELRAEEVYNIDLKYKIDKLLSNFHINCCIVIDNSFAKSEKKKIRLSNQIIEGIFYERDKNSAHKDADYINKNYASLKEMIDDLKTKITEVKKVCTYHLPDVITLDFVPHDRETFRLIYGLTTSKENEIIKRKYPLKNSQTITNSVTTKAVINDISEIKCIPEGKRNDYCITANDGINEFEGLQNRQDFAIKVNLLYDLNIWPSINQEVFDEYQKLKEIGIYDDFNILHLEKLNDESITKELDRLYGGKEQ